MELTAGTILNAFDRRRSDNERTLAQRQAIAVVRLEPHWQTSSVGKAALASLTDRTTGYEQTRAQWCSAVDSDQPETTRLIDMALGEKLLSDVSAFRDVRKSCEFIDKHTPPDTRQLLREALDTSILNTSLATVYPPWLGGHDHQPVLGHVDREWTKVMADVHHASSPLAFGLMYRALESVLPEPRGRAGIEYPGHMLYSRLLHNGLDIRSTEAMNTLGPEPFEELFDAMVQGARFGQPVANATRRAAELTTNEEDLAMSHLVVAAMHDLMGDQLRVLGRHLSPEVGMPLD
jgi:hypothetical protein